jgi:polygalacturonase
MPWRVHATIQLIASVCLLFHSSSALAADEPSGWDAVPGIMAQIRPPVFPDRDFPLAEYGAVGDGKTDCKPAVDKAIAACHEAGGGRVVVPAGEWLVVGPIHLLSNVNLHVESGATVRFINHSAPFLPAVFARYEGNEVMNFSPFIYAFEQENIAITGGGTIDGQAGKDAWWDWKTTGVQDADALRKMGEDGVEPSARVFGKDHHLRPNFVQPYRCKNVLIEGVTFTNSPMWNLNPVLCENVTIRGVTVSSHGPNNDGCDPESCRNVLIENCTFDTGDDCIAIKSGRNADGRRIGVPSENIIIRGCTMKDGHGGVVLGSEMSGGIRNVYVEDCTMDSPHLLRAIRLKSNSSRGGYLKDLYVRNVQVGQVADAVVKINLQYDRDRGDHYPTVENVVIDGLRCAKAKYPLYVVGLDEAKIRHVLIENCTWDNVEKPSVLSNVEDIELRNFQMVPKEGPDHD